MVYRKITKELAQNYLNREVDKDRVEDIKRSLADGDSWGYLRRKFADIKEDIKDEFHLDEQLIGQHKGEDLVEPKPEPEFAAGGYLAEPKQPDTFGVFHKTLKERIKGALGVPYDVPKGEGVGSGVTPSEMIKPKHQDVPEWAELADLSPKKGPAELAPERGPGDTQFFDDDGSTKPVPKKPSPPRLWDGQTLPKTWTTGQGRLLNIRDMGNDHLTNTIRYLERCNRTGTKHWMAMCKERHRRTRVMQTMTDMQTKSPVVEAIKDAAASKAHEKRQAAKRAVKKQELEDMAAAGVGIYKRALSKLGDAFR